MTLPGGSRLGPYEILAPLGACGMGEVYRARQAAAVPVSSDSGYFWFFSPSNLEVVVKVLDGCSLNGHHWVFAAGLTNVEVTLTVLDTVSGELRTYVSPAGTAFPPIQDTSAFATCP